MIFSNKVYDVLKFILQVGLPALAALVFGITSIWGLAWGEKVIGTISVVEVALGILLGISTKQYNKSIEKEQENNGEQNEE